MRSIFAALLLSLFFGFPADAGDPITPFACGLASTIPQTKTIIIKNNTPTDGTGVTIYPVIQAPIFDINTPVVGSKPADLWMQAECGIPDGDSFLRTFPTSAVRGAYINIPTAMNNPPLNDPGIDETTAGVPPGATVTITVPFYTRMQTNIRADALGRTLDQFIDWWNSVRIYVFYGKAALYSAFWEAGGNAQTGGQPTPLVLPNPGPTCTIVIPGKTTNCTVNFQSYPVNPQDNVPFQLQEYTFASAVGPPPGGNADTPNFSIEKKWVNYNVSSLDSVYLPVAMGPILKQGVNPCGDPAPPPPTGCSTSYLGDVSSVSAFNAQIAQFTGDVQGNNLGQSWPYYIPIYFAAPSYGVTSGTGQGQFPPKIVTAQPGPSCSLGIPSLKYQPFPGAIPPLKSPPTPYLLPKIPGTFNALLSEYNNVYTGLTQTPPSISGQPPDLSQWANYNQGRCDGLTSPSTADPLTSTPGLGTKGKAFVQLWKDCTAGTKSNQWCDRIKFLNQFFQDNWSQRTNCQQQTVDLQSTLAAVYGFVPITAPLWTTPTGQPQPCLGNKALIATTGQGMGSPAYFNQAITKYCELQYNYLTPNLDPALVFNPYTQLIHQTLGSSAYAFSIDDAVSFRHLVSDGVIITLAGPSGLDDPTPSVLPNFNNFQKFCRQGQVIAKVNTHDFNADGMSDILWYNTISGQVLEWLINGATVIGGGSPGSAASPWAIVGQRDFNGDGFADILWRNGTSGQMLVWLLNSTTVIGGGSPGSATSDWTIAGTGDFNGDGFADILWYNTSSGQALVWLLKNGTTVIGGGSPGSAVIGQGWTIAGTGDFNGDGLSDILWYNTSSGQALVWFLNGATVIGGGSPGSVPVGQGWTIAGTGDFNGDGFSDILWYNTSSGQVVVWLLNGANVIGGGSPGSVTSPWTIVETGDFNGDKKSDILWYNTSSGQTLVWLLNGATAIGGGSPGSATSPWQIQVMNAD